jgi:hypothetical protein
MPASDDDIEERGSRIAQHIAAAPDGFDVIFAAAGQRQFLAQLADETSMILSSGSSMPP